MKEISKKISDRVFFFRLSEELADMAVNLMMIPHAKSDFSAIKSSSQFHRFWLKTSKLQKVNIR